ncbi:MAG: glycoside hydrolase family 127 protein [Spirosomataceae bacterium]
MKITILLSLFIEFVLFSVNAQKYSRNTHYITNQPPLLAQPYTALPLGTIQPKGWLKKMLETQRDGLTGKLDSVYALVCGENNGWLGGTGDSWERGPYWIDGLVPLAYILNDTKLKAKAQAWIEWSIKHQRPDGYFGPYPFDEKTMTKIKGTQQTLSEDWWPKMVMLKVFQQYYTATQDKRVLTLMDNYFKYQLKTLKEKPLGKYTFWAEQRGGDNLQMVYWLYNITQEKYLLELGELIHQQTFDWTTKLTNTTIRRLNPLPNLHCVNVAQGIKEPLIYYQQHPENKYMEAVKEGLTALKEVHGFVNGMYGGDEQLHGNDPTQGSELCSAVEFMYSFESILPITGDVFFADYLEKIAYNVLPTQHDDRFMRKQYFQQVNQIEVTDKSRNFANDRVGRMVFGTLSGYPCCVTNMHQGYPKLVQNLWYATADNGLAALVYGASEVKAKVANGKEAIFSETTNYPFSDHVQFTYKTKEEVTFPLHLRIPEWCKKPILKINGQPIGYKGEKIVVINRQWSENDLVSLELPMEIQFSRWFENSLGIERGPLVYALKIGEAWREVKTDEFEDTFYEVTPTTAWNYGISSKYIHADSMSVTVSSHVSDEPWNLQNAPITITAKGKKIPFWEKSLNSAGKIPFPSHPYLELGTPLEELTLIPYGCTTLRIAQFPVVDAHQ